MSSNQAALSHYSGFSRTVHWLTVLLMAGMFYTGFVGFGGGPPRGAGGPGGPGGPPGATMAMRANVPGSAAPAAAPGGAPGGTMAMRAAAPGAAPGGTMAMRAATPGAGGPGGMRRESPFGLTSLHKAMGFTILLLTIARLIYRVFGRIPPLPSDMPSWQVWAARGVQGLIYLGIVVQPLSGWLGSGRSFTYFGIFTMPPVTFLAHDYGQTLHFIHTKGAWVLIWLICLHAIGALYHHYVRKDKVLVSMLTSG